DNQILTCDNYSLVRTYQRAGCSVKTVRQVSVRERNTHMAQWRLKSEHYLPQETIASLEGRLCLGFVNTMHPRYGRHIRDALAGYADLVAWNRSVGMLTEAQEQGLLRAAVDHSGMALRVYERAIALREATYRVVSGVAAGNSDQSEDLTVLHNSYVEAL